MVDDDEENEDEDEKDEMECGDAAAIDGAADQEFEKKVKEDAKQSSYSTS